MKVLMSGVSICRDPSAKARTLVKEKCPKIRNIKSDGMHNTISKWSQITCVVITINMIMEEGYHGRRPKLAVEGFTANTTEVLLESAVNIILMKKKTKVGYGDDFERPSHTRPHMPDRQSISNYYNNALVGGAFKITQGVE